MNEPCKKAFDKIYKNNNPKPLIIQLFDIVDLREWKDNVYDSKLDKKFHCMKCGKLTTMFSPDFGDACCSEKCWRTIYKGFLESYYGKNNVVVII